MTYRTIVFDFDGTIADTLEESRRIFNVIAPDYKIRPITKDEIAGFRHFSMKEFINHMDIPKRRVPLFLTRGTLMMRASITSLPLIEGMGEVLVQLRPHVDRFGILTSNAVPNVELFLESNGIRGLFDFISSTSKLTGKSRYLRRIRKQYSLRHEQMLYVGDELRDLKAAKKAGIPFAGVTWGFNSRESLLMEKPEHLLEAPSEFLALAGH
jgi:phosphoglycolate phosphatase